MTIQTAFVEVYAPDGKPAPLYQVEYIESGHPDGPIIVSVYSAMGQRLDAAHHPRFRYWLVDHLKNNQPALLHAS